MSLLLLGASWLAWRNYRVGRADVGNAMRLAAIGFVGQSLGGIVSMHHAPTPVELSHVVDAIGFGLFIATTAGVLYLALEPFVRRRWPQTLISWTRLLAGDVRDPLVAGHILLGVTFAVALAILRNGMAWYQWQAMGVLALNSNRIETLDVTSMAQLLLTAVIIPAAIVMGLLFLFILFRLVLRNTWVAAAAVVALGAVLTYVGSPTPVGAIVGAVNFSLLLWVTLRFGILPGTLVVVISTLVGTLPLTSDFSAWYASRGLTMVVLTAGLAIWSFRNALGGRKVLADSFLEA
jgi:serine/threonine-protein kinase